MINLLNQLGSEKVPFLFLTDFDIKHFYVKPLAQVENDIFFSIDNFSNFKAENSSNEQFHLKKKPSIFNIIIKPLIAFKQKCVLETPIYLI